jgi:hypothetical protein
VTKDDVAASANVVNDDKKLPTPPTDETKVAAALLPVPVAKAGDAQKAQKSSGKKSGDGHTPSRPLMAGRRRTSSHDKKTSGGTSAAKKEKEPGPASKKVKQSKEKEPAKPTKDVKSSGLPSDLE